MSIFQAQKFIFEVENCIIPVQVKPVIESAEPLSERLKYTDIIALTIQIPIETDDESRDNSRPQSRLLKSPSKPILDIDDPDNLNNIVPSNTAVDITDDLNKTIELETVKEALEDIEKPKVKASRVYFKRRKSSSILPKG